MEKMPRRLKRFHRKKEPKHLLEKLKGLSGKKQKQFNEKMKAESTPDKVAEELFEQIKVKEGKKGKTGKETMEKKTKEKETNSGSKKEIPLWKQRRMQRTEIKENPKKEGKKTRMHGKRKKTEEEEKEAIEPETETKQISIQGLFSQKKEKEKIKKELNDLNLNLNLDEENETEIKEKRNENALMEFNEKTKNKLNEIQELNLNEPESEGKKCVNCGQQFNVLIFCPECGNAFCDKCTKAKQKEGAKTKYLCPHCGNAVKK